MARVGDYARQFENLPGAVVDLKDGVGGLAKTNVTGDEIVFIGKSVDGPSLEPVGVSSYEEAEEIFGPYYDEDGTRNGANLSWAAKRALDMGADNISLMRIGGQYASGEIGLNSYYETKNRQSRQYFGEALGNEKTKVDLFEERIIQGHIDSISSSNRKNYRVDNITVYISGDVLSGRDYRVDNDNMVVTIRKGVTDAIAPISIAFDLIEIDYGYSGYLPGLEAEEEFAVAAFEANEAEDADNTEFIIEDSYAKYLDSVYKLDENGNKIKNYNIIRYGEKDDVSLKDDDVYVYSFNDEDKTTRIKFASEVDTETGEEVVVEYKYAPTGSNLESAESTSKASERQFDTRYDSIVPSTEVVFQSFIEDGEWKLELLEKTDSFDGSAEDNLGTYTIDYDSGRITTFEQVDIESGEEILVAYRYNDNTSTPGEVEGLSTLGDSMVLTLENRVMTNRSNSFPVVLLADGEVVDENAYSVDTPSDGPSVITLEPGNVSLGQEIEATYYWEEEIEVEPVIQLESINPGSLYNETSLTIEDSFFQQRSNIDFDGFEDGKIEEYVELDFVEEDGGVYTYVFPDTINIGSEENPMRVPFDRLSYDIEDLTLYKGDSSTEVSVSNPDEEFEVYHTKGRIDCEVPSDEGLISPKFSFSTTPEKVSFVRDESLQRISSTEFRLGNDEIVKDATGLGTQALELYINDSSQELDTTDYDVNWGTGTIILDPLRSLGETDNLICKRYAYHNINGKQITIRKPRVKVGDEESRVIEIDVDHNIQTIGQLIEEINEHSRNNVLRAKIDNSIYAMNVMNIETPDVKIIGNVFNDEIKSEPIGLVGGRDDLEVSQDRMYTLLEGEEDESGTTVELGAYDVLMEYEDADIIVPLEVYADEELSVSYHNFANQLAQFCARCFYNSNEVVGIIGVEPIDDTDRLGVIERHNELTSIQTLFFLEDDDYNVIENNDGSPVDIGKFMSIFAHDIVDRSRNIDYPIIANGAVEYAALNSMLPKDNAPTNEILDVEIPYTHSKRQLNALTGNRMVTLKEHGGDYKITDSPTCSFPNSGWNRYLTVNIVFDIMDKIRDIYDRYIGGGNTLEKRNSLESEIRQELITSPLLKDFNFNVQMSPNDEYMGRLIIPLELVPVTELRRIETVVSIHAQL